MNQAVLKRGVQSKLGPHRSRASMARDGGVVSGAEVSGRGTSVR